MSNLTAKQKIIIGLVVFIMLIVIGIYGYMALNKNGEEIDLQNTENSNELQEGEETDEGENLEGEKNNEESKTEEKSGQETEKAEKSQENKNSNEKYKREEKKYESLQNLEGKIVVHITGAVKETGILILPEGARIADAIEFANGTTKEADLDQVNLAYILEDGQKIYIPKKSDKKMSEIITYITSDAGKNVILDSKGSSVANESNRKININTATQNELETLPGIGPSTAKTIIEYREAHGKFEKIEDLKNIKGIGEAKFENIKDYIEIK